MTDSFYRKFEDKFRGSREIIKSRLKVYIPFLKKIHAYYPSAPVLDLGCGRGEWLEVLANENIDAVGIDIDDGMLEEARKSGLIVRKEDALQALRATTDETQLAVSGFHIAEHLEFDTLKELVHESLRVLVPGGLLILETPNPENLVVGTSNFYLDPTHQRPIPPGLLAFIPEYFKFKKIKILRLQESSALAENKAPNLLDVLNGASPDFAVVAQKDGPVQILDATQLVFDAEYGLTLETLANRYQQQSEARTTTAEAEARAALAEARIQNLVAECELTRKELHDVHQSNHHHWKLAEASQQQIQFLLNSTSWRITAPLRWSMRRFRQLLSIAQKPKIRTLLKHIALYVRRRPWLKHMTLVTLKHFPSLKSRLSRIVFGIPNAYPASQLNVTTELSHLSPRARQIYTDLKTAISLHKKENS